MMTRELTIRLGLSSTEYSFINSSTITEARALVAMAGFRYSLFEQAGEYHFGLTPSTERLLRRT